MDIGLNIADGVRVRVGDTLESITSSMEEHNVEYTIPYSSEEGNSKEMIMFMEKCGVELNIFCLLASVALSISSRWVFSSRTVSYTHLTLPTILLV